MDYLEKEIKRIEKKLLALQEGTPEYNFYSEILKELREMN